MSILDRDDFDRRPPPEEMAAQRLKKMTKHTFDQIVNSFNEGSRLFWANNHAGATPEKIAHVLGSDAKEVFYLHARLGELIALVKPEAISDGLSVVGNFTMNEDGSVTILPPPEPEIIPESGVMPQPETEE